MSSKRSSNSLQQLLNALSIQGDAYASNLICLNSVKQCLINTESFVNTVFVKQRVKHSVLNMVYHIRLDYPTYHNKFDNHQA